MKDYPPFTHSASMMSEMNRVNENGRFRVVTIPGPVLVMVAPTDGNFRTRYKPAKPDPDAAKDDTQTSPSGSAPKGPSPQRFVPTEQVRADFDVSFPIDI